MDIAMGVVDFGWKSGKMWQPCACFPGFPQPPGHVAALSPTGYIEREAKRERERQDETRRNKTRPDSVCAMADILQTIVFIYIYVCV